MNHSLNLYKEIYIILLLILSSWENVFLRDEQDLVQIPRRSQLTPKLDVSRPLVAASFSSKRNLRHFQLWDNFPFDLIR